MNATTKRPLHADGGTPVEEADMPLADLDINYSPDTEILGFTLEDKPVLPVPAIVQNGDPQNAVK